MTDPDWEHPPVTLGRFLVLYLPGLAGVAAYLHAARDQAAALAVVLGVSPSTVLPLAAGLLLVLLAAAVAAGLHAAPRMGFNSRLLDRLDYGTQVGPGLRADLGPAAVAGLAVGLLLVYGGSRAPEAAVAPQDLPPGVLVGTLPLGVLYGGIVEELVARWGLVSALALGLTAGAHRRPADPSRLVVAAAIVLSAGLAALGHLPAVAVVYGVASLDLVAWVLALQGVAGLVLGWLFWRQSLEAAVVAHALAHVVLVAALAGPLATHFPS